MFEEFLEEDRQVCRITKQDIHAFKRALSETPANYVKRFPGTTLPDAVKANKARAKSYPTLSTRTINDKYLARLHSILNWCVRSEIIPDNPATGIKVDAIKKSERPRVNFSPDDLIRLFNPKHFNTSTPFNEMQWAMIISLFSGMRASELAQMQLNSIRTERGVLVFAVEEETKNAGSQRLIPAHSTILAHGLEKRVASLRNSGKSHLFQEWYEQGVQSKKLAASTGRVTLNHYFPRFIPRRFINTYLPKVGIVDSRKRWHSFRHTFKTGLARAGVPRSMQDDLCGHADNSAGAGYVHGSSVEAMKDAIEKLRFDGFAL